LRLEQKSKDSGKLLRSKGKKRKERKRRVILERRENLFRKGQSPWYRAASTKKGNPREKGIERSAKGGKNKKRAKGKRTGTPAKRLHQPDLKVRKVPGRRKEKKSSPTGMRKQIGKN